MDLQEAPTDLLVRVVLSACLFLLGAGSAAALDMTSASYSSLGGNPNGGGSLNLTSTAPSPTFEGGGSLGQSEAIGLSGSSNNLTTSRLGFWAIVQGRLPSLDADSDQIQSFLDDDDDNDGLSDAVETRTQIFISPSDTGTHPNDPDSDGDGVLDGAEVSAGTDPNVFDPPDPPTIPALSTLGRGIVVAWIAISAARRMRRSHFRQRPSKLM